MISRSGRAAAFCTFCIGADRASSAVRARGSRQAEPVARPSAATARSKRKAQPARKRAARGKATSGGQDELPDNLDDLIEDEEDEKR